MTLPEEILKKMEDVFLWVRLVLEQLLDEFTDGGSRNTIAADLKEKLMKLPEELGEFYQHTIDRLDSGYKDELLIIAQLILCTRDPPMSLGDFFAAFRSSRLPSDSTLEACLKEIKDSVDRDGAERFIHIQSAGLVELVKNNFEIPSLVNRFGVGALQYNIQFICQSVNTFFERCRNDSDGAIQYPPDVNGHLYFRKIYPDLYLLAPRKNLHQFH